MKHDESLAILHAAAEAAVAFRRKTGDLPQHPLQTYGECLLDFTAELPEHPASASGVIAELVEKAERGLMMSTGPRFFGWVIGSSHPVGVAADWLTSAWGQNTGNHHAAPAAAAVETVCTKWLLELLDLPRESSVGFVTGATVANFTCLAAARGELLRQHGWDADRHGLFGAPPITVLIGDDAHTTVFSALQYLGLGHDRVVRVATDAQGAILPDAFRAAVDKVDGPLLVILQAGQINTGGFDPFEAIIPMAKSKHAWVHVDGAFGLWARATASARPLAEGIERADSWATDGHKWLQTPYDCGYAIVRHELAHRRAMSIAASYLPETAAGERDPTHYVPELSRRARGFATWSIIKTLGRSGIAEMVERHCRIARAMAAQLSQAEGVHVENDVVLNQVIVRFGSGESAERGDEITQQVIARLQRDGTCFAGGAKWRGRQVMRVSVIGGGTTDRDGARSAEAMLLAFRNVMQQGS
jgi:glutamate/tyrosine decarboxylase-like PLP-dependent enzyme